jgi:hypothetical protein
MSAHFKWYPASEEVIVPWNARYSFPSQANKAVKLTPRIPPKNGSIFNPGNIIRLEFPAQGYVNPINTTLEFDVTLMSYGTAIGEVVRFQNNIQTIFNRVRMLYGSTPLEDIINYNVIVRCLTEWTSTNQQIQMDQTSIAEGIGGTTWGSTGNLVNSGTSQTTFGAASILPGAPCLLNTRQSKIQGIDLRLFTTGPDVFGGKGNGSGMVPNSSAGANAASSLSGANYTTRRYQVNLALGLMTQDKLIPVKFMASQLAIEITLEQAAAAMFSPGSGAAVSGGGASPSYVVSNVNLIPEVLEFDSSYDAMFLKGLQDGGVPIKFSSWHTFQFSTSASSNVSCIVQERSRSVKGLFAVQRRAQPNINTDSHATFFDTSAYVSTGNTMQSYQWRIGARYFPAQPVQNSLGLGSPVPNGGAESFVELQKFLNVVGDYRLAASINTDRWAVPASSMAVKLLNGSATAWNELDYETNVAGYGVYTPLGAAAFSGGNGSPCYNVSGIYATGAASPIAGSVGSACYASAINLETSNGVEISGLNSEEQSDISFNAFWQTPQGQNVTSTYNAGTIVDTAVATNTNIEVYSFFDAMIILRENNVVELIQ